MWDSKGVYGIPGESEVNPVTQTRWVPVRPQAAAGAGGDVATGCWLLLVQEASCWLREATGYCSAAACVVADLKLES
ncbi:hypothetical protein FH972_005330 [Carpinus fangiana]|nr:hypothetical protein FH972_005330 [Carpinus fangiana]